MKKNVIKQSVIAATVTLGLSAISVSTVYAEKVVSLIDLNTATVNTTTNRTTTSLSVRRLKKTMSDGIEHEFWVFCKSCAIANLTLPGPTLTMKAGTSTDVLMNMMMAPQEGTATTFTTGADIGRADRSEPSTFDNPYIGHTIHLHGLDMESEFDGVPETYQEDFGGPTKSSVKLRNGFTYQINSDPANLRVDPRFVGSHMYHCHVHTVKHLEMGMYGAFVVKSKINANRISNTLYPNNNNVLQEVLFDDEWIMMISTVDPEYHKPEAKDDLPVFAKYNPKYFLVNGEEGDVGTTIKPELTKNITLQPGETRNLVIRLMGIHSSNATFSILSANNTKVPFTVYNKDGFALITPKTVTSVELSPGQTKDVMISLSAAGTYFPQVMFGDLRNNVAYNETFLNSTVLKSIVKTQLVVTAN